MEGTRFDQVEDLIIQIDEEAYRVIGDRQTAAVLDNDEIMRVEEVLTDQPATVTQIGHALESTFRDQPRIPPSTLRRHLDDKLVAVGRAVPHGKGGHRDPYRYSKAGEAGQVVQALEQSSGIPDNHSQPYVPNTDTLSKVAGEDLSTDPPPRAWTSGQPASNRIGEQGQQLSVSLEVPPPAPGQPPDANTNPSTAPDTCPGCSGPKPPGWDFCGDCQLRRSKAIREETVGGAT